MNRIYSAITKIVSKLWINLLKMKINQKKMLYLRVQVMGTLRVLKTLFRIKRVKANLS